MLIPTRHLKKLFGVSPSGVLHVGAHLAEEFDSYHALDFGRVIWVEAQEALAKLIETKVAGSGDLVLVGAVWSASGEQKKFNLASNSQSSSLYEFGTHSQNYPGVVFQGTALATTTRLDELLPDDSRFDFVNLDIQGAELEALLGLGSLLSQVRWIYTEVNREEVYEGCPLVEDMDLFLEDAGFSRVYTIWTSAGWGDALYVRSPNRAVTRGYRLIGDLLSTSQSITRLAKKSCRPD
jgi:FkbM family methyltransferase